MFAQPLFHVLKGIPHVKYEKKTIDNAQFRPFFTILGILLPRPHPL